MHDFIRHSVFLIHIFYGRKMKNNESKHCNKRKSLENGGGDNCLCFTPFTASENAKEKIWEKKRTLDEFLIETP